MEHATICQHKLSTARGTCYLVMQNKRDILRDRGIVEDAWS